MNERSWVNTLDRTRRAAFSRVSSALGASELTQAYWNELEAALIQADIGAGLSTQIVSELIDESRREGFTTAEQALRRISPLLQDRIGVQPEEPSFDPPEVILIVGVNGSGKTTSAAKLAYRNQARGRSVLVAAADTYRAAATEQLQIWGERLGIDVISGMPQSDPAAVVYNASQAARARGTDLLIVDTSGRMHTEHNLMAELEKITRVAGKAIEHAPHQTLLVMDATTGQNGLSQAKSFADRVGVTGIILAKLDSSARGGVGLAIVDTLHLPILYVGTGEGLNDLAHFNPEAYLEGLLPETG